MYRKSWDLIMVCLLTAAAMVVVLATSNSNFWRLLFGVPLVLVLPGYALAAALFPERTLDFSERLLFALGLSLVMVVGAGLALNLTPWGVQESGWATLIGCTTWLCSGVAHIRRAPWSETGAERRRPLRPMQGLLFGLAALLVVGTMSVARLEAAQSLAMPIVQLWALPMQDPGQSTVHIGLQNGPVVGAYKLQVQEAGFIIQAWPSLTLAAGGRWETTFVVPPRRANSGQVEILLYRQAAPDVVYRRVTVARGDGQSK